MKLEFFTNINSLEELKKVYRELCKVHHPDKGGDNETMKRINLEYSYILENSRFDFKGSNVEIEEKIREIIEKTIILQGLIVELCGRWIWFSGNSFEHKETLKKLGCRFASKKRLWYWHDPNEVSKNKKVMDMSDIRNIHGSKVYSNEKKALQN